jgi:hypothetical protein
MRIVDCAGVAKARRASPLSFRHAPFPAAESHPGSAGRGKRSHIFLQFRMDARRSTLPVYRVRLLLTHLRTTANVKLTRADRGARLRASLPAALLTGPQPHRRGLRQGQGAVAEGSGQEPRGFGSDDGRGPRRGHCPGRSWLLRALWLPRSCPVLMTSALEGLHFSFSV